jgi:aspartate/methionine/tyrosine aminotransferase
MRFAEQLLEHGIIVLPGAFLGPRGAEYVRFALVPPLPACRRAVEILSGIL